MSESDYRLEMCGALAFEPRDRASLKLLMDWALDRAQIAIDTERAIRRHVRLRAAASTHSWADASLLMCRLHAAVEKSTGGQSCIDGQ